MLPWASGVTLTFASLCVSTLSVLTLARSYDSVTLRSIGYAFCSSGATVAPAPPCFDFYRARVPFAGSSPFKG